MRSDEIVVGLIGAIVAIASVLIALRSISLNNVVSQDEFSSIQSDLSLENQNQNHLYDEETQNLNREKRQPILSQPELRISETLKPFNYIKNNGDIYSPQEIIQERHPVLLRGYAETDKIGLKNISKFKRNNYHEEEGEYLISNFKGWALRNVRGQIHSPNYKLSTLSNKNTMIFDGMAMSDFFESAHEPTAPYWFVFPPPLFFTHSNMCS